MSSFTEGLYGDAKGLRIGLVKEGFGRPNSEPDVDDKVRAGATLFKKLGATVDEISLPMHLAASAMLLGQYFSSTIAAISTLRVSANFSAPFAFECPDA